MEIVDALKSIILGLSEQTRMGSIKWIDDSKIASVESKLSFVKGEDGKLDQNLYYRMDRDTFLQVHFSLYPDHSINYSWIVFENDGFQDGRMVVGIKTIPEYADLEKVLFDKYITPKMNLSRKNNETDKNVLINIASKCGLDVVRDMKLNSILNEDGKKGWFKSLF